AGYLQLIAWEDGDRGALETLRRQARELPESFRARLLLRLAAKAIATRGGAAAVALLEPAPEPPFRIPLPAALRARWRRRRLERTQRLVEAGRVGGAAAYLAAQPDARSEPGGRDELERARGGGLAAVTAAIDRAEPRERRALLLRRYEHENDLGEHDAAHRTLQAWLAAHAEAGTPTSEAPIAEAVARRLAELDIERGD